MYFCCFDRKCKVYSVGKKFQHSLFGLRDRISNTLRVGLSLVNKRRQFDLGLKTRPCKHCCLCKEEPTFLGDPNPAELL